MGKYFILILILLILSSCSYQREPGQANLKTPQDREVKGYIVPSDSLVAPKIIPAGKPKTIKAAQPKSRTIVDNTVKLEMPLKVKAYPPEICIPGINNFAAPYTCPAIIHSVSSGIPKIVMAEKAHIMKKSLENFSSYGKLQGFLTNTVLCITQDDFGNLWFGSSGGISRYDGNTFAHYTSEQGLCDNDVISILHDSNNNLWIGTQNGGVSCFDGKYFTNFSEKEGMLDNTVLGIMEDNNGNIWFATEAGAAKFDGKSFTYLTEKSGLVDNYVYSIFQDKNGAIWFATEGGISKFDGHVFSNYIISKGADNNRVVKIIQDTDGYYWLATKSGTIKFDGDSFIHYSKKEGFSNHPVYSIEEDISGNLWFGTWGDGVYKYDGQDMVHFTENDGLTNDEINCIFEDQKGILWFGTRAAGAVKYGGNLFHHFTSETGMGNNQVQSIIQDKNGNIWCGTWGIGLAKYDGKSFYWYTEDEGLSNDDVRCIIKDRNGDLWMGTWMGVSKFDGVTFTHYTVKEGLCNNFVICILEDKEGNLWFGSEGGGVSRFDGKNFVNYGMDQGLSNNDIKTIIQDKKGNIWFGTNWGVTKFEPDVNAGGVSGTFTHYTESEGLPHYKIITIYEDQQGNIWIGSFGGGLIKYDGKYFTHYTEADGLCENGVMSIIEDRNGSIWIGTRLGVSHLSKETLTASVEDYNKDPGRKAAEFLNYKFDDGFFGIGCNANAICEDHDGTIWIGANDRLTTLRPESVHVDKIPPDVQITGIDLFNEFIPWPSIEKNPDTNIVLSNGANINHVKFDGLSKWYGLPENLSLSYDDNYLTFHFIGITTRSPQSVRYKYRLEGLDENWSTLTDHTIASYGNLPDGQYSFIVEAMTKGGNLSDSFVYNFSIRPPFWKSKGAYLVYVLMLILGVFIVDRIQTQRVVARERERARDRELELAGKVKNAYEKLHLEHEVVEKQKEELEVQKSLSDELLRNILPTEVAEELKAKGSAEARYIDEVTVLFTDFQGFTKFSEKLSPRELVAEIHECFSAYDRIVQKYNVEKIKTIGDSYMAAGGLPITNRTHASDVIKAAMEIQQFMYDLKQKRIAAGKPFLEIRLGINSGPVVAGIVGVKKFAYDIWGDTVNTASHMEKSGEVGRINISGATYQLVKDEFPCEYRGKIEAKNKGMIDMYFVNCE